MPATKMSFILLVVTKVAFQYAILLKKKKKIQLFDPSG